MNFLIKFQLTIILSLLMISCSCSQEEEEEEFPKVYLYDKTPIFIKDYYVSNDYEVEFYVGHPYETSNIGHSFIRVNTLDQYGEIVYDYGRYGKSWGYLKFTGEGIMRVWKGRSAINFLLKKQMKYRNTTGFTFKVTKEQALMVYKHFEKKLANAKFIKEYKYHKRYRLEENFDGITRQCTAMALSGIRVMLDLEEYYTIFDRKLNLGFGFNEKQRNFFFAMQKKQGTNEVAVPLDVLNAFNMAFSQRHANLVRKTEYRKNEKIVVLVNE